MSTKLDFYTLNNYPNIILLWNKEIKITVVTEIILKKYKNIITWNYVKKILSKMSIVFDIMSI